MRAHTITTKARVGGKARTKGTIVPRGILALSLAVVLLAATASTASAERVLEPWYCEPLPTPPTTIEQVPQECRGQFSGPSRTFDFGDRQLGTTSPAQRFALAVYGTDTFTPSISVSGDYTQTNNCPPTLSAGALPQLQGCLINVTFAPTGTGPRNGTLSTGPGGPTTALTGTGVTTPTPWDWPLEVSLDHYARVAEVKKKLWFLATTTNDSTLVVRGKKIKRTTKRLAAGEQTTIKARLKHPSRFTNCEYGATNAPRGDICHPDRTHLKHATKINVKATDEFDQTATEGLRIGFFNCVVTC